MSVMGALSWFDNAIKPASGLAYQTILKMLSNRNGLEEILNSDLLRHEIFRDVLERTLMNYFKAIMDGLTLEQRDLVVRIVADSEILKRAEAVSISDPIISRYLLRILNRLHIEGCDEGGLRCLLNELARGNIDLKGVFYGLNRLRDMAFERKVDPLDFAALLIILAKERRETCEVLSLSYVEYLDSNDIVFSELAYILLFYAVFQHRVLLENVEERLRLIEYSPNSTVACRARQLLERILGVEVMEEKDYPRPCLLLGTYKGRPGLYVIT